MAGMLDIRRNCSRPSRPARSTRSSPASPTCRARLIGKRFQAEYFLERRLRRDAWLRLSARQRHRYGAGARLRGGQLGKGLWRLRHEARPRHAAATPWLPGDRAGAVRRPRPSHATSDLAHSPRAILRKQIARLTERGYVGLLRLGARVLSVRRDLRLGATPRTGAISRPPAAISRTTHPPDHQGRERVMRAIRNGLQGAGIPVENSKGEWGPARRRSTSATPTR